MEDDEHLLVGGQLFRHGPKGGAHRGKFRARSPALELAKDADEPDDPRWVIGVDGLTDSALDRVWDEPGRLPVAELVPGGGESFAREAVEQLLAGEERVRLGLGRVGCPIAPGLLLRFGPRFDGHAVPLSAGDPGWPGPLRGVARRWALVFARDPGAPLQLLDPGDQRGEGAVDQRVD